MALPPAATPRRRVPSRRTPAEGIALRHSRRCGSRQSFACSCRPTFQAQAWSAADRKPIRKTFPTLAAARAWRQETKVALRRRQLSAPTKQLVREAAESGSRRQAPASSAPAQAGPISPRHFAPTRLP